MVWTLIEGFRHGLKTRGGLRKLVDHLYTNGDLPFKVGTYMGCDAMGNRYYENRVDYPIGQHRWVEPADIHNYDASMIPPEWHGWMHSMNDVTPYDEKEYFETMKGRISHAVPSDAPYDLNVGHQEPYFDFHGMHNQSQIRSRGYGVGNWVVGLPADGPDNYYVQPGSPYHPDFVKPLEYEGDLDEKKGGGRPYKNELWKKRLMTEEEKKQLDAKSEVGSQMKQLSPREEAILARGGSLGSS